MKIKIITAVAVIAAILSMYLIMQYQKSIAKVPFPKNLVVGETSPNNHSLEGINLESILITSYPAFAKEIERTFKIHNNKFGYPYFRLKPYGGVQRVVINSPPVFVMTPEARENFVLKFILYFSDYCMKNNINFTPYNIDYKDEYGDIRFLPNNTPAVEKSSATK